MDFKEVHTCQYVRVALSRRLDGAKLTNFFSSIIDTHEKTLVVSVNGTDSLNCSQSPSCRTIGFVLTHRAVNNDIIKVKYEKSSKDPKPFFIHGSFSMFKNITLLGINGRPIISVKIPFGPKYLFNPIQCAPLQVFSLLC